MAEAVRLVVWDLDETFWKGTVTEGGIQEYVQEHHDIVIELARRGIVSSICSKNDAATILPILQEKGILEYFIFPSISWDPKGMRLSALIASVGLRAETVIFIDDNPNNRAEALATVPGIQVESESFIPHMLADARFKGKDDSGLSRLKQYKLLETRKRDEQQSVGNEGFLRSCDVRVCIEYDVMSHLDRVIELINRTNQLNFTKRRLPENIDDARRILSQELNAFHRQAGLVRVIDKYGDYGFVGFFATETLRQSNVPGAANCTLRHFCFSCRTLGMFIEQWLYRHLRCPELKVVGEVVTDLFAPRTIDWVTLVPSIEQVNLQLPQIAPEMRLYGGCEANAVGIYLGAHAGNLQVYGNYLVGGLFVRLNSAVQVLGICRRTSEEFAAEADILGLPLHQSAGDIFANVPQGTAFVFNCGRDATNGHFYRHKTRGWALSLEPRPLPELIFTSTSEEELIERVDKQQNFSTSQRDHVLRVSRHIRENYTVAGPLGEGEIIGAMRDLITRVPEGSKCIIAIDHDERRVSDTEVRAEPRITRYAAIIRQLAAEYPYVGVVSFSEVLEGPHEIQRGGGNHYDRAVYMRFAQRVVEVLGELSPRRARLLAA